MISFESIELYCIALLTLIGGVLLGRDVFLGMKKVISLIKFQKKIKNLIEFKNSTINVNESLRLKNYPNQEVDALNEEIIEKCNKNIKALNNQIDRIEFDHIWKNFKYGSIGLLLLAISFVLQIHLNYTSSIELTELKNRIEKLESKTQYK